MQMSLEVSFFESALGSRKTPTFSPDLPYRPDLMVEGIDELMSVEFLEVAREAQQDNPMHVLSRTTYPEVNSSSFCEGTEFFIVEGGNLVGKGSVCDVSI
jgi:hypothetical protein